MSYSIGGTDCQTANIHVDLVKGYNEPADVRGEDDVIPEAAGREEGEWIEDVRYLTLDIKIEGTGATLADRQASWRTASDTLRGLLSKTTIREHIMGPPDHGLDSSWSINARCVNVMPGPILNQWTLQKWSAVYVSIDSPPEWVEVEST